MTQEEVSAAMDALHNDFIEAFKKHAPRIQGVGENRPADVPLAFAMGFAVALGNYIANAADIPANKKPVIAAGIMEKARACVVVASMAPKQGARQ